MDVLHNPHEKFLQAVDVLATSSKPIQTRLEWAAASFSIVQRREIERYPEILAAYDEMYERITAVRDTGEGYISATVKRLSDEEAEKVAEMIFGVYSLIVRVRNG